MPPFLHFLKIDVPPQTVSTLTYDDDTIIRRWSLGKNVAWKSPTTLTSDTPCSECETYASDHGTCNRVTSGLYLGYQIWHNGYVHIVKENAIFVQLNC